MSRFAVIDIYNLYFRAAKGCQGDAFTRAGMALHVTFKSLRKMIYDMGCDHLVVCAEGRSWRYDVYPEYKAKRKLEKASMTAAEREDDAIIQNGLSELIEFLRDSTRVTVLRSDNIEGDDFIARFVQVHPNDQHIILSSDSDFIQLIADNVSIYDAMMDRIITKEGVKNSNGKQLVFEIGSSTGKISIKGTLEEEIEKHRRAQKALKKEKPDHEVTEFSWDIDDEWWKRALFVKMIRGDSGDGIFSAFPGIRYKGSKNKVGIADAWADRNTRGFEWNNFMNQTWEKAGGFDENGEVTMQPVVVKDEIERNRVLIDLTAQPDNIKAEMDAAIIREIQKEPVKQVGVAFLKFCGRHDLQQLAKEAQQHGMYLNVGYPIGE